MTLNISKEFLQFSQESINSIYVLYVDKKIWGYSEDLESSIKWCEETSKKIKDSIQEKKPHYKIDIISNEKENSYVVNCISPGYLRNGYKIYTVSYEQVFKVKTIPKLKKTESCGDLPIIPVISNNSEIEKKVDLEIEVVEDSEDSPDLPDSPDSPDSPEKLDDSYLSKDFNLKTDSNINCSVFSDPSATSDYINVLNSINFNNILKNLKNDKIETKDSEKTEDYCPPSPPLPPLIIKKERNLKTRYYRENKDKNI